MSQDIGIEIEFARMRKGVVQDSFEFFRVYMAALDQKNKIVQIPVAASIEFAERYAIWIKMKMLTFPN